jgi:hypothetical protein
MTDDPKIIPFGRYKGHLGNLTVDQLRHLWRSESFRAVVKERLPQLYVAEKLFGEPDVILRGDRESVLAQNRYVIDSVPPTGKKLQEMEELVRDVDELMKD